MTSSHEVTITSFTRIKDSAARDTWPLHWARALTHLTAEETPVSLAYIQTQIHVGSGSQLILQGRPFPVRRA